MTSLAEGADVIIPASIDYDNIEYIVTELNGITSNHACYHYNSIYIPQYVEKIHDGIFYFNAIIESIEVAPDNPNFMIQDGNLYSSDGEIFFCGPRNAKEVNIREGVKRIVYGALSESNYLETVVLPSSLEIIDQLSFAYSKNLHNINLSDIINLKSIGDCAFEHCQITSFHINRNLESFGMRVFSGCPIIHISVSPDNPIFSGFDGCIYSKDYTELIICPSGKETVSFPSSINSIGQAAFAGSMVESLNLPGSITSIGYSAFSGSNLREITIPSSVKSIPTEAFFSCHKLQKINLNEGLERISGYAYYGSSLTNLVIPKTVSTIYDNSISGSNCTIAILNPQTNIRVWNDNSINNIRATFYAAGQAYEDLKNMSTLPNSKVYQLPERVFAGAEAVVIGPDSEVEWNCSLAVQPASGVQFDLTLPAGLSLESVESENENLKVSFTKLESGDYRVIAYTSDNSEIVYEDQLTLKFTGDATLERGKILVHDGILSVFDTELACEDQEILVAGYSVNINLPESMIEGDEITLDNPIEGAPEGVTYTWSSANPTVATIEDNSTLKAGKEGTVDITLCVVDPEFTRSFTHVLEVFAALWGDVDGNESVDIADLVAMINYILERNPENFNSKLADIDRNGRINIVDVTSLVKIILSNQESDADYAPAMRRSVSFGTVESNGAEELNISLEIEGGSSYSAMQGEIVIPEGLSLENISLNGELGDHSIDYAMVTPTTARFIIYSTSLAEMNADETKTMLNLTVKGTPSADDVLTLTNAMAVDSDCTPTKIDDQSIGFDEIVSIKGLPISGTATVTDLTGRIVAEKVEPGNLNVAPGIYLVTYQNGRTVKIIVK